MKSTKGVGHIDMKDGSKDCIFYICFSSTNLAEAVIIIGSDMIVMVKTNTKEF